MCLLPCRAVYDYLYKCGYKYLFKQVPRHNRNAFIKVTRKRFLNTHIRTFTNKITDLSSNS